MNVMFDILSGTKLKNNSCSLFLGTIFKRFRYIGIFYCFSAFGTILNIIINRFRCSFLLSVLSLLKDSNTLESFIVFLISVLSLLFFFFSGRTIALANLRNRTTFSHQTPLIYGPLSDDVHKTILVSIQITVLDLEPNPDFQTFLIISKTYHRIFNCNTSKRRSGQELPFIFFELRAPTCL